MMKKKSIIFFLIGGLVLSLWHCRKEESKQIALNRVGQITGQTDYDGLKQLFPNDSVGHLEKTIGLETQRKVDIYDGKTKKRKLDIIYKQKGDTLQMLAVEVWDPSYRTAEGLNVQAPYGEWKKHYPISRVETTLRHVVVFIPALNATLVFPYDALAQNAQHNPSIKPDADSIRPDAVPEVITVFFEK